MSVPDFGDHGDTGWVVPPAGMEGGEEGEKGVISCNIV